jgi:hypothetical protein
MFQLYEGNHQHMDLARAKFFRREDREIQVPYSEMGEVVLPNDYGGMGITNTRMMNDALY